MVSSNCRNVNVTTVAVRSSSFCRSKSLLKHEEEAEKDKQNLKVKSKRCKQLVVYGTRLSEFGLKV